MYSANTTLSKGCGRHRKINRRNFLALVVSEDAELEQTTCTGARSEKQKRDYTMRMNANGETGTDTQDLERYLDELLAPERLPGYIASARYELGTDHIGEPAVRIFLAITPETDVILSKDKAKLKEYSDYKSDLSSRILKLESGYFPFIRLVEAA
jgi:hypothetical protein